MPMHIHVLYQQGVAFTALSCHKAVDGIAVSFRLQSAIDDDDQ